MVPLVVQVPSVVQATFGGKTTVLDFRPLKGHRLLHGKGFHAPKGLGCVGPQNWLLGPPVVPFYPYFGWFFLTEIDYLESP